MPRIPARFPSRFCSLAVPLTLLGGMWLAAVGPVAAQGTKAKPGQVVEPDIPKNRTLRTKDGVDIRITYYKSMRGKEAPVVVLLHEKDGNRFVWQAKGGLAERLQKDGFAVITVDLRQHGESKGGGVAGGNANNPADKKAAGGPKKAAANDLKPGDYKAMAESDLEAVKSFIFDEHQEGNLNMNKMGIVAAEMSANVATQFAAADWLKEPHSDGQPGFETPRGQDVRAMVLISPQPTLPGGMVMSQALTTLRSPEFKVAFLFATSKEDSKDRGQTKKLYEQAASFDKKNERVFQQEYPGKLRGTGLLGARLEIEDHIVRFLGDHLMKLDSPWRDRKSKLER